MMLFFFMMSKSDLPIVTIEFGVDAGFLPRFGAMVDCPRVALCLDERY